MPYEATATEVCRFFKDCDIAGGPDGISMMVMVMIVMSMMAMVAVMVTVKMMMLLFKGVVTLQTNHSIATKSISMQASTSA